MDIFTHVLIFLAILIGIVTIAVCLENLYWRNKDSNKLYGLKETLVNFSLGASYKVMDAAAIALYVYFLYDLVKPYGLQVQIENSWLWFPVIYLLVDLFFYFTHLIMHKVRWFWTGHVTHHSSDRYNYSVALRQNFTVVLNGALLIWWIPSAVIGFDKQVVLLAMELNLLYQFLLHTEMPSRLNMFGKILNTPSHHRVHHGSNATQIDRNFAGTFIIWDRLFGTFRAEQNAGELVYGVTRLQPHTYNPVTLIFHEWKDMFRDFIRTKDLRVFFCSPGWIDQHDKESKSAKKQTAEKQARDTQGDTPF